MAKPATAEPAWTTKGLFSPDPGAATWHVEATWTEIDGRPECIGLRLIKAAAPGPNGEIVWLAPPDERTGITSTDLRSLPLASILSDLMAIEAENAAAGWSPPEPTWWDRLTAAVHRHGDSDEALERLAAYRRGAVSASRPRSRDDFAHYAVVAAIYLDAYASHRPPTKHVADTMAVPHSTAAKWVARARTLGLIDATSSGRTTGVARATAR
jgi:hypothetical protein